MALILRCRDLKDAGSAVSSLYGVAPEVLEQVLPSAAERAQEDRDDPIGALPHVLAAKLRSEPATPARIHYFHGTRAGDPDRFLREGLRPLGQVVETLWHEIEVLVPELSAVELRALRADLTAGRTDPRTYGLRVTQMDHGPHGHLLRDVFSSPRDYASVDYLAGAEIVIDICQAIEERFALNATGRYRQATTPCIVEFSVATSQFDQALASALWYLATGLRGQRTINANWTYSADGQMVPAKEIVSVQLRKKVASKST